MLQRASTPTSSKPDNGLGVSKAQGLSLYRMLLLARRAEEKIREEYFKDEMKTPVHLGIGAEAISVGVIHCLPPGYKAFGTYRNHSLYLTMTEDTDGFFGELYGKAIGPGKGKAGSMHIAAPERGLMATSAVVGTTIPVAVGAALANAYRQSDSLVVSFFGDGALEEGVFWESFNFACLKQLRVLFVCEDNGLAIHTPTHERQGFRAIEDLLKGFECHVASGDGSDLLGVIQLTRRIVHQMTEDPKPGFLRLNYYRFLEHVGPREDFDAGYRRRPTPEEIERLDPVIRFERSLTQDGCSPEELDRIRAEVEAKVNASILRAKEAPFAASSELWTDLLV